MITVTWVRKVSPPHPTLASGEDRFCGAIRVLEVPWDQAEARHQLSSLASSLLRLLLLLLRVLLQSITCLSFPVIHRFPYLHKRFLYSSVPVMPAAPLHMWCSPSLLCSI